MKALTEPENNLKPNQNVLSSFPRSQFDSFRAEETTREKTDGSDVKASLYQLVFQQTGTETTG